MLVLFFVKRWAHNLMGNTKKDADKKYSNDEYDDNLWGLVRRERASPDRSIQVCMKKMCELQMLGSLDGFLKLPTK